MYLAASPDVPDYYIINDAPSRPGDRVCLTGAIGASNWGTSCTTVVAVNVAPSHAPNLRLVRVERNCALRGDSGGPYFSGHVAYGLHQGGVDGCGEHYYQDLQTAENLLNVNVIHGG